MSTYLTFNNNRITNKIDIKIMDYIEMHIKSMHFQNMVYLDNLVTCKVRILTTV